MPKPSFPAIPPLPDMEGDHFHDECGVFGICRHVDAAAHTALGLHALQHRGQEAAGIVSFDGRQFHSHRALGHVGDNFNSGDVIDRLPGEMAIGHNRYSTSGDTVIRNETQTYDCVGTTDSLAEIQALINAGNFTIR